MPKKLKLVGAEGEIVADPAEKPVPAENATETEKFIDGIPIMARSAVNDEIKEKLESLERTEKENRRLAEENSMLSEKLAEYISEISELRKNGGKTENEKLKTEIAELRKENDEFLVKISELTFDNARLNCSISELRKKLESSVPAERRELRRTEAVMPNPASGFSPYRNGGYSYWN